MSHSAPHNEPLVLLDIRGLIIRRYSVASTSDGIRGEDGKIYAQWYRGVVDFMQEDLLPLLEKTPPRRIICCWDGGNNYRTSLYPAYKKARRLRDSKTDPIHKQQMKEASSYLRNLTAYLGVKHVQVPGQEADDLIALFCRQMPERAITVHTSDADLLQLAGDHSNVYVNLVGATQDAGLYFLAADGFENGDYKGCPLDLIRLQKSIVGDSSDSYGGVPGLGPKAWDKLVDAYGYDGMAQLEQCVKTRDFSMLDAALTATGDKLLSKLLADKDTWMRSYKLASLNPDTCYQIWGKKVVLPKWYVRLPLRDEFAKRLEQVGGSGVLPSFEKWLTSEKLLDAEHHLLLRNLKDPILNSPAAAYDFESEDTLKHEVFKEAAKGRNYVDVLSQKITGISFCIGDNLNRVFYVPIWHKDTYNLSTEWARYVIETCSANPVPVAHNALFELSVSRTYLELESPAPIDTVITSSYVDENDSARLKDQAKTVFNYHQTTYDEVTQGRGMSELTGKEVLSYGCDDSLVTAHLFDLHRLIMQLEGSWEFYLGNEVDPAEDDANTFIAGTNIDFPYLEELQREDLATKEASIASVRKALETHCIAKPQDQRIAHATTLYNEAWAVLQIKERSKFLSQNELFQMDQEEREAAVEQQNKNLESVRLKLWEKCWSDAAYQPYVEEKQEISFSPTAKQLTHVTELLGAKEPVEKNTATYLSDWMHLHAESLLESPLKDQFVKTLGPAAMLLSVKKKREGEDYERFKAVCLQIKEELGGEKGKNISRGDELNFDSPPQMAALLYGKLGLPVRRRSKIDKGSFRDVNHVEGTPATGNKAIASALVFDEDQENPTWRSGVLKDYKKITACIQNDKLYYTPYPLWVHPRDGKIHPQIKNCGTVTRRPSGTAPNKLQVSKKEDAKIRKAYVPASEERCYVCLDFNGQELRLTASESKDPVMIDAYIGEQRKDLHSVTAANIAQYILPRLGLPQYAGRILTYDEFMAGRKDEETSKAFNDVRDLYSKAGNFLITYGGGYKTLAENILIAPELAKAIIQGIFNTYRRLEPWQDEVAEFGRAHGYVETAYGNRKHLTPAIVSDDKWARARIERQAVNQTIQGCAADILKIVRQEMSHRKMHKRYHLEAITPIYDEIAADCPIAAAPEYVEEMAEIMSITPPGHPVPMVAEAGIGLESWGHKVELKSTNAQDVAEYLRKAQEQNNE